MLRCTTKMDEDLNQVLFPGVAVAYGPVEREPEDYDDGYVLPAHSVKPLQLLNHHPNDIRLKFYEVEHIYTYDDVPLSISVTALAHEFERPFDPDGAIGGMKVSRSQMWPRLEYVNESWPLDRWSAERGALATCAGKTVAVIPPYTMSPTATQDDIRHILTTTGQSLCNDDDFEFYAFDRSLTDGEIRERWNANGQRASHMGTDRHYLAECFMNGLPHRWWEPDMQVLYRFCRQYLIPNGIVAFNTEKEIVCKDADVAGSIDLILWDTRRKVHHILDFKRSNKLRSQMRGYGKMAEPFKHLDDCKGAGYALQTSIYQYILERDYGMTIGDRILLSLHEEQPFETSVPYMKAEVEYIMNRRFALVRARTKVADADPLFRCDVTGAPLVDAVVSNGRRMMEKVARVNEWEFEIDAETREAFDMEVARSTEFVELDAKACTSWRRQMPEHGIVPLS